MPAYVYCLVGLPGLRLMKNMVYRRMCPGETEKRLNWPDPTTKNWQNLEKTDFELDRAQTPSWNGRDPMLPCSCIVREPPQKEHGSVIVSLLRYWSKTSAPPCGPGSEVEVDFEGADCWRLSASRWQAGRTCLLKWDLREVPPCLQHVETGITGPQFFPGVSKTHKFSCNPLPVNQKSRGDGRLSQRRRIFNKLKAVS